MLVNMLQDECDKAVDFNFACLLRSLNVIKIGFTNCCYLFALETELSVIEVPKGQLRLVSEL